MAGYVLTRRARADLVEIGRYTRANWGELQRNRYLAALFAEFDRLGREPLVGVPVDDLRPGYRRGRQGRHLIFYRTVDDRIEIVRVLHERMDIARHLNPRAGR